MEDMIKEIEKNVAEMETELVDNEVLETTDDNEQAPVDKAELVKKYQKALISAINAIKDDLTAATQIKESSEDINSFHTVKKTLNNLQRKINKLEELTIAEYSLLSMVCYFNAERMVKYGQSILEQAKVVNDLAKNFTHNSAD
jgi:hypothetical protein